MSTKPPDCGRRVRADEEALAAECGALQRLHDAALGLGLQLDAGGHRHHGAALDTNRFVGSQREPSDPVRGTLASLYLHDETSGYFVSDLPPPDVVMMA